MITVDGIEYRNLEEQVQFLTNQYNGLDETFASKEILNDVVSVLNDQQAQITSANQQIANVNQQVQTVDGKFANYVPITGTQTLDAKIFKTEIALQSPEGEITRLKNINHNIVLTNGNGVNLLNIDEQLQKVQAFGKTLATMEDIATGQGTKVTVGGQVQSTWDADTKADKTTVSTLSQTVSTNSQNISSNTLAITELAENKADKTSIPSIAGLASEAWVNQQISAEATTRQQADTNLQNQIDSEESTRSTQFTALESAINSEVSSRQQADTNLQNQITDIIDAINTGISKSSSGYAKLPNGLIVQWVNSINASGSANGQTISLPTPFTNSSSYAVVPVMRGTSKWGNAGANAIQINTNNASSFVSYTYWTETTFKIMYIAIGY